jgi:hypothetical protein
MAADRQGRWRGHWVRVLLVLAQEEGVEARTVGVGFRDLANGDLHHSLLIFALQDVICCAQDRRVVEDKQGVSRRDSRRGGGRVRKD